MPTTCATCTTSRHPHVDDGKKHKQTGECLSSAYFWASNMLLIDCVSRQHIEEVIDYLIKEGEFEVIFTLLLKEAV